MATPKRRKLDKDLPDSPPVSQNTTKHRCFRCGSMYGRQKGNFPVSHSPMYRGIGYLPWCSDCIDTMYDQYLAQYKDSKEAMRRICMKLDLYWSESLYGNMDKTVGANSRVRNYIGKTNLLAFIDKTFDDTIKEEAEAAKGNSVGDLFVDAPEPDSVEEVVIPQEMIDFWGAGHTYDFYNELDRRYKWWVDGRPEGSPPLLPNEVALYKQICLLEITINRDSAQGKTIDRNVNMLNTLLGSMNLKPAQQKDDAANAMLENTPFGVWIQKWESLRPIPDPDPSLADVDGIVKYVTTWLYGHLAKMLGVKNVNSRLYDEEIARYRVKHPEFEDDDDDELLYDVLSNDRLGGD